METGKEQKEFSAVLLYRQIREKVQEKKRQYNLPVEVC